MSENLNENEIFLKHIIGTTNLFSWISQWRLLNGYNHVGKNNSIFNFDILMSQRFMLGFPLNKLKYGHNPFLAFQSLEYSWISAIIWRKAAICLNEKRIYLVSKKIKTIYNDYIPSFAISIEFSNEEMLEPLLKKEKISLKHLWYDDELEGEEIDLNNYENPNLSPKSKDITIPLLFIESQEDLLKDDDLSTNLTGDLDILDSLRVSLSIGKKEVKFIKGTDKVSLSETEKEFLKTFLKPLDYNKPKIRISVD